MFKRFKHNIIFNFIISQDYLKLPNNINRSNDNIYHISRPNIFGDVQNHYRDRTSMDLTFNEIKLLTSSCWYAKYHPVTTDRRKDKYTENIV